MLQEWVNGQWKTNSFESGLLYAQRGDARSRALAIQKLYSKRGALSEVELNEFRQMLEVEVAAASDDPLIVATAIRTLAELLDYLRSRGLVSQADVAADGKLLLSYVDSSARDIQVRGAAIRALGNLGIGDGREPIEQMLSDDRNVNTPEIARNGCLALVKLAHEEAIAPVRRVFEKTSDSTIFGTAAFCLGQINNIAAMSALMENIHRFPDSASCDAALVNMDRIIVETLNRSDSPYVIQAIQATEHLWKDGQRDKYLPALQTLLSSDSAEVRRASCERLIDAASRLPLDEERRELSAVLSRIHQTPELREYAEKMRQRLTATVLVPASLSSPAPSSIKELK
jgi:HEAT repeat protein